jgi:hypothetical protein
MPSRFESFIETTQEGEVHRSYAEFTVRNREPIEIVCDDEIVFGGVRDDVTLIHELCIGGGVV